MLTPDCKPVCKQLHVSVLLVADKLDFMYPSLQVVEQGSSVFLSRKIELYGLEKVGLV